jgi:hypothetical protein
MAKYTLSPWSTGCDVTDDTLLTGVLDVVSCPEMGDVMIYIHQVWPSNGEIQFIKIVLTLHSHTYLYLQ